MNNVCLFAEPVSSTKVRNGVYAHKYPNGVINIQGEKYVGYSIREAISKWRRDNPKKGEKERIDGENV